MGARCAGRPLTAEANAKSLEAIRDIAPRTRRSPDAQSSSAEAMGLSNRLTDCRAGHLKPRLARKGVGRGHPGGRGPGNSSLLREGACRSWMPPTCPPSPPAIPPSIQECRNLPRLHDFESIQPGSSKQRPDYFVRVDGDSLDRIGFASWRRRSHSAPTRGPGRRRRAGARIGEEVTLKRYQRIDSWTPWNFSP